MIRNGFTKKKVGTLTLGEQLKKLRSDKRIALNEVSRVTRVQARYLERLEEGDWSRLPPDVYVKGFIRSYAEFLGVDDKSLLRLYEKEKGIKRNLENQKSPQKKKKEFEPINITSFVFTPKKVAMGIVVFLVCASFFYLYKQLGSFSGAPQLVVTSPKQNEQIDGNLLTVEGKTDQDANIFINDQPILVNDDGKFRETLTVNSGVNVINIRAVNRFGKEEKGSVTVQSNYASQEEMDSLENETAENESQAEDSKIGLELRVEPGPVWLSVEVDGSAAFSGTMLSGAIQTFSANEKIVVNSGRGDATYVKFNGHDAGTLSKDPGAVRGMTFDKDTKY